MVEAVDPCPAPTRGPKAGDRLSSRHTNYPPIKAARERDAPRPGHCNRREAYDEHRGVRHSPCLTHSAQKR
jgi:hypothetical protein